MRQSALALRDLFGPFREVSLEEICGEPIGADEDRCDGCRRAVALVTNTSSSSAHSRRRYCGECAKAMADAKPVPPEYA
jgi:hypothetical protein